MIQLVPVAQIVHDSVMTTEPKDQRVPVMMTASEVEAIDTWSFANRVRGRSEAIRQLVAAGLKTKAASAEPAPDRK